jgi:hypothetical protein
MILGVSNPACNHAFQLGYMNNNNNPLAHDSIGIDIQTALLDSSCNK